MMRWALVPSPEPYKFCVCCFWVGVLFFCLFIFFSIFAANIFLMKIKLTKTEIEKILSDPQAAESSGVKVGDPWWVVVLKVVSYLIGLVLAGVGTAGCARLTGLL